MWYVSGLVLWTSFCLLDDWRKLCWVGKGGLWVGFPLVNNMILIPINEEFSMDASSFETDVCFVNAGHNVHALHINC